MRSVLPSMSNLGFSRKEKLSCSPCFFELGIPRLLPFLYTTEEVRKAIVQVINRITCDSLADLGVPRKLYPECLVFLIGGFLLTPS